MSTASNTEKKLNAGRHATLGVWGEGVRNNSCYSKGQLEWGGGWLLNGFVEASILISVYYVDQNSINARHYIIARTITIRTRLSTVQPQTVVGTNENLATGSCCVGTISVESREQFKHIISEGQDRATKCRFVFTCRFVAS